MIQVTIIYYNLLTGEMTTLLENLSERVGRMESAPRKRQKGWFLILILSFLISLNISQNHNIT